MLRQCGGTASGMGMPGVGMDASDAPHARALPPPVAYSGGTYSRTMAATRIATTAPIMTASGTT